MGIESNTPKGTAGTPGSTTPTPTTTPKAPEGTFQAPEVKLPEAKVEAKVETKEKLEPTGLEALANITGEQVAEFAEGVNHTGMQPLSVWLPNLPPEVRQHLANFRKDYTEKTQAISVKDKKLTDALARTAELEKQLIESRGITGGVNPATLLEGIDLEAKYDLYDPVQQDLHIKRQSALHQYALLKPGFERQQKQLQVIKDREGDVELEKLAVKFPEMKEKKISLDIFEMLTQNPNMALPVATELVVNRIRATAYAEIQTEQKNGRRKDFINSGGSSTSRPKGQPDFSKMNEWEIYQWHKVNTPPPQKL